jgi:hypothetical protein
MVIMMAMVVVLVVVVVVVVEAVVVTYEIYGTCGGMGHRGELIRKANQTKRGQPNLGP